MTDKKVRDRVAAGVAFMDEHFPDWRDDVDPGTLDISQDCGCVLGQYFGSYGDSVANVMEEHGTAGMTPISLGIGVATNMPDANRPAYFAALTTEWQHALRNAA